MRVDNDLTVVIPYSGDYRYLKLCLKVGLSRQEIKPKHLIIVFDNCDSDHIASPDKYEISGMQLEVFSYLDSDGKGNRSAVRNTGIEAAKTEWIFFMDEDIILLPSYFKELQKIVNNIPDNHIINGSIINRKLDMSLPIQEIEKSIDMSVQVTDKERQLPSTTSSKNWMTFRTGNLTVSKRILIESGLFDEKIKGWGEEDTEMGYRVYKAGGVFFGMRSIKAYHLTRDVARRQRNRNWAKNLEYTLGKHHGTEYAQKRNSTLNFARRYS